MRPDEPFVLLGATNGQHRGDPTAKSLFDRIRTVKSRSILTKDKPDCQSNWRLSKHAIEPVLSPSPKGTGKKVTIDAANKNQG
jgi:hypothetical protein